ncbi:MAG: WD40/YVTN/BNR-like repeat-containing protein, partial [Candidatus Dormibacteria bacterium]
MGSLGAGGNVMPDADDLGGAFSWRFIGPPRGGRSVAVAGDPQEPAVFYFGSCGGGVWKTNDAGNSWRNISDGQLNSVSVGALAVATSDPQVIYVGTGEACPRNDVIQGDGIYRSTDGGRSWQHRGLRETLQISRVRVSPRDPDLVYVAALGDIFGPSEERGIYRSRDGGESWEKVLSGGPQVGAADLWMAPSNPRLLYATLWEAVRQPWNFSSGGAGSRLFRSTDGGDSWADLTERPGLPKALLGRMGVAAAPTRPQRVWAVIEAAEKEGGLFRSEDGGESWERISDDRSLLGRPWYYSHIVPDPQDPETLYAMNYNFVRSTDGGKSWLQVGTPHGDNHDLWIDPKDCRRMIEANDGGACVSLNGAETFSTIYNQPTAALYKMAIDDRFPYRVLGTQQDNSAIRVPSRSKLGAILRDQCEEVGHSESGYIAVDPRDDNIVYSGAVGSSGGGGAPLLRYDHRSGQTGLITIWPEWTYAEDPGTFKHRFAWTYPIVLSRHDPSVLYAAGERVFVSRDEGMSWKAISPDLSRNDPEKLRASGGPITKDTSGAEVYCTAAVLAESPHDALVLWVGTDDGLLHRSSNAGETWEQLLLPGLPDWSWISGIEVSQHDPKVVMVSAHRYRLQDRAPYIYRSTDAGKSWTLVTKGIAQGDFVRVVRGDPSQTGTWYAGTEHGPYCSFDDGEHWQSLRLNLPPVPIYDLGGKHGELVAATHGRGFWVLDDARLVRQMSGGAGAGTFQLLVPPVVHRYFTGEPAAPTERATQYRGRALATVESSPDGGLQALVLDAGQNPPDGVVIRYRVDEAVDPDLLELRIFGEEGEELRVFRGRKAANLGGSAPAVQKEDDDLQPALLEVGGGFHRLVWNLRAEGVSLQNQVLRTMVVADQSGLDGPRVPPGRYRIELRCGDEVANAELEVVPDPNLKLSAADYQHQYQLLLSVRDNQRAVNAAIRRCRQLSDRLRGWEERQDGSEALRAQVSGIRGDLSRMEKVLTQPEWRGEMDEMEMAAGLDGRLFTLQQTLDRSDAPPTRQAQEMADKLFKQAETAVVEVDQLIR